MHGDPGVAQSAAPMPEWIGRYEVLLPIATGGMATVYLARARGIGGFERDVALKLTHAHLREDQVFAREVIEEAKLAARVRHPNVVPVLDVDADRLGVFLVMEYVEGESLAGLRRAARAAESSIHPRIGLRILIDALAGLNAAHELNDENGKPLELVHRDFSPQNILVGLDGMGRLADFGIAKAATRLSHTKSGLIKGKIAYMSPEQARDENIDRRADIWAAGVIAWELLAGRRLYSAKNETATLLQIVNSRPPLLRSVVDSVSSELSAVIARALEPVREKRFETVTQLSRELTAAAGPSIGIADHSEVADTVRSLVGEAVARRRERATEIRRLRGAVVDVAALAASDAERSAESGSSAREPPLPASSFAAPEATSETNTTSASPAEPVANKSRSSIPAILLGVIAIGALLTAGLLAVTRLRSTPSTASAAAPPTEPAASIRPTTPIPAATASTPVVEESAAPASAAPSTSAAPSASAPRTMTRARAVAAPPHTKPPATSKPAAPAAGTEAPSWGF